MTCEGCSNLPDWPHASAVYSKAYAYMHKYGADVDLIEALTLGDEELIKARMLELNFDVLVKRAAKE